MKKIGLSVCYDTKNFGSQLQVLATVKKIEELGYKTEIIRYKKKITPTFIVQTVPRFFNKSFVMAKLNAIDKKKHIYKHPEIAKNVQIRNNRFGQFVNKYYKNFSKLYSGWETLTKETSKNYDGFLCGSDQLWLPSNLGSHFYTLEFAPDNKPKIAYATSFGVSQIPWYQKKRTRKYLSRFSSLSSREEKGIDIIRMLTGKEVPVVCDPTLLLEADEWTELFSQKAIINGKYIFCYFLGTNTQHRKIALELKKQTGFKIITIPFLDNFVEEDMYFGDLQLFDVDAADFINLIRNAEYVLTDSFHGSVFSILNHKQFITLNRFIEGTKNSRNSRIDSLCSMLGLEARRYKADIYNQISKPIDYRLVDMRLNGIRDNSENYLKRALQIIS